MPLTIDKIYVYILFVFRLILILPLLTACASLKTGKAINYEGSTFLTRAMKQDDREINPRTAFAEFKRIKKLEAESVKAERLFYVMTASALLGGYFVGSHLVKDEPSADKQNGMIVGGSFITAAIISAYFYDLYLEGIVKNYNSSLGRRRHSWELIPSFMFVSNRQVPAATMQIFF